MGSLLLGSAVAVAVVVGAVFAARDAFNEAAGVAALGDDLGDDEDVEATDGGALLFSGFLEKKEKSVPCLRLDFFGGAML